MHDRPPRAALIPVKSFELAKGRLAEALPPDRRAELARMMATRVVAAARPLPTYVVCGSPEVAAWATAEEATVIWFEPPGLNPAVGHAAEVLHREGYERMVVVHGDLPLATSLDPVTDFDGVTIVPDRRDDGTNVLAVPLGRGFRFRYGGGSASLHRAEAERLGLPVVIVNDDALGLDIDVPDDLDLLDHFAEGHEADDRPTVVGGPGSPGRADEAECR